MRREAIVCLWLLFYMNFVHCLFCLLCIIFTGNFTNMGSHPPVLSSSIFSAAFIFPLPNLQYLIIFHIGPDHKKSSLTQSHLSWEFLSYLFQPTHVLFYVETFLSCLSSHLGSYLYSLSMWLPDSSLNSLLVARSSLVDFVWAGILHYFVWLSSTLIWCRF